MKIKRTVLTASALILLAAMLITGTIHLITNLRYAPLRRELQGKRLSLIGDSISTYEGVSNGTDVNDTLGEGWIHYSRDIMRRRDTWWQQTADKCGLDLLVNNSWSGSTVVAHGDTGNEGCGTRAENLHDNTLENNEGGTAIVPDIIAVYLGINDYGWGTECGSCFDGEFFTKIEAEGFEANTFDEAYALMIYKIKTAYPNADIFLLTIPCSIYHGGESPDEYNDAIRAIGEKYGCVTVSIHKTKLSSEYEKYTLDKLHPNKKGMDIMTDCLIEALEKYYLGC